MAKNTQSWGRDTARKRYAEGGEVGLPDSYAFPAKVNDALSRFREQESKEARGYKKGSDSALGSGTSGDSESFRNNKEQKKWESGPPVAIRNDGQWPTTRKSGGRLDKRARFADGGKTPTPKGDVKPVQIGPPQFGDTAGRIIAARTSGSRAAVERAVKDNRKTMYGED